MHRCMRTLGHLFRMKAPQFDSRRTPLRRQRERTTDIRSDMLRRWTRR